MDAYDRCTNLGGKKPPPDSVAIYGRGQELLRPLTHPRTHTHTHTHTQKQTLQEVYICQNKDKLGNKSNYKFTPQFLTLLSVEYRCKYNYMQAIMHAYL
jgi:hypothetical protein